MTGWGEKEVGSKPEPPSVFVCMPTYDTMQVNTCLSLIQLFDKFTLAKIKANISTFKCPYVGYGRNILTALFLDSKFDYQLFVDADVEFKPDVIGKMIIADKDMVCCPYPKKTHDLSMKYSVAFKDHTDIKINEKGLVEISKGPAGLTMIHRRVYEKLMKDYPEAKIKHFSGIDKKVGDKYLYNFWDTEFKDGTWLGEDVYFSNLVEKAGFKFYAVVDVETIHHGNYGWKGKLIDTFQKANGKST